MTTVTERFDRRGVSKLEQRALVSTPERPAIKDRRLGFTALRDDVM
ncbi:MAG: hypothetical protein LBV36_01110 [Chromatiales bacterium]|nr:hypothetical protein [Chromatiales bacterium]